MLLTAAFAPMLIVAWDTLSDKQAQIKNLQLNFHCVQNDPVCNVPDGSNTDTSRMPSSDDHTQVLQMSWIIASHWRAERLIQDRSLDTMMAKWCGIFVRWALSCEIDSGMLRKYAHSKMKIQLLLMDALARVHNAKDRWKICSAIRQAMTIGQLEVVDCRFGSGLGPDRTWNSGGSTLCDLFSRLFKCGLDMVWSEMRQTDCAPRGPLPLPPSLHRTIGCPFSHGELKARTGWGVSQWGLRELWWVASATWRQVNFNVWAPNIC